MMYRQNGLLGNWKFIYFMYEAHWWDEIQQLKTRETYIVNFRDRQKSNPL